MKTNFKVYTRKIHVYREANDLDNPEVKWVYVWSTNAYKTCGDAVAAAEKKHHHVKFKASFSKD